MQVDFHQQKKETLRPPFYINVQLNLFHDELLNISTSVDEVDASVEVANVDGIGTSMAFHIHHILTHDVVDHDVSVLAEGNVELVSGRIRIDIHVSVVVHFRHTNTGAREEVVQFEGEALVVVVCTIIIV